MTPQEERKAASEEAAGLHTYLATNFPECRPEYPKGLFAWAQNALVQKKQSDQRLIEHVQAAEKRSRGRGRYITDVLNMVLRHFMPDAVPPSVGTRLTRAYAECLIRKVGITVAPRYVIKDYPQSNDLDVVTFKIYPTHIPAIVAWCDARDILTSHMGDSISILLSDLAALGLQVTQQYINRD